MTTPDGITLLGLILLFAVLYATVEYHEWARRDEDRRIARMRERGLS